METTLYNIYEDYTFILSILQMFYSRPVGIDILLLNNQFIQIGHKKTMIPESHQLGNC